MRVTTYGDEMDLGRASLKDNVVGARSVQNRSRCATFVMAGVTGRGNPKIAKTPIGRRFQAKMPENALQCLSFIFVFLFGLACLSAVGPAQAQVQSPPMPLPAPELALRLKKLESELRCLVCQNQTLAESPAGLAGDLRREVRTLIDQGKTDDQIKAFLQARYGDFVLYKPPLDPKTYLLWYGPFGLLIVAAASAWWLTGRRRDMGNSGDSGDTGNTGNTGQLDEALTPQDARTIELQRRARALLEDDWQGKDERK